MRILISAQQQNQKRETEREVEVEAAAEGAPPTAAEDAAESLSAPSRGAAASNVADGMAVFGDAEDAPSPETFEPTARRRARRPVRRGRDGEEAVDAVATDDDAPPPKPRRRTARPRKSPAGDPSLPFEDREAGAVSAAPGDDDAPLAQAAS